MKHKFLRPRTSVDKDSGPWEMENEEGKLCRSPSKGAETRDLPELRRQSWEFRQNKVAGILHKIEYQKAEIAKGLS